MLKICTFNIRVDTPDDGINSFSAHGGMSAAPCRMPIVKETLKRELPDIIGFQEVRAHVRTWIEENFPEYCVIGCGREGDRDGESTPIAYRRDRFYLLASDTFWLSPTPYIPGSRFPTDQSGCPRTCCCAVLMDRGTKRVIRVYNTHLDHVGERAREQGMKVVLERMERDDAMYADMPCVLMGDFNATPDSPFLQATEGFVCGGAPMTDVSALTGPTFHEYHPDDDSVKIDYIFTNADCDPTGTYLLTDEENGVYLSDHYPVICKISL